MTDKPTENTIDNASLDDFMSRVRAMHMERRRVDLTYYFELGDLIITASIRLNLYPYDVIKRIRADLGILAYGETTYQRAAHIAQVFTKRQRQTLIAKSVPLLTVDILATKRYDGERRHRTITDIKIGRIKSPWGSIMRHQPIERPEKRDSGKSEEYPPLSVVPPFDSDKVLDIQKCILSHIRSGRSDMTVSDFDRVVMEAKRELGMVK